jgi:hypothetical protein
MEHGAESRESKGMLQVAGIPTKPDLISFSELKKIIIKRIIFERF